ncbi:hypothetical protein AVEN_4621-1 [Araneus ventricosus]|uniref:Uncharacterized protein n=1 Tax=Araneus ventricosus TaxID=182803 RepID=A0A4Y2L0B3_ARAVE|nr:hypothetical protein AVEN_4621-1 [Araneus ventricosus]
MTTPHFNLNSVINILSHWFPLLASSCQPSSPTPADSRSSPEFPDLRASSTPPIYYTIGYHQIHHDPYKKIAPPILHSLETRHLTSWRGCPKFPNITTKKNRQTYAQKVKNIPKSDASIPPRNIISNNEPPKQDMNELLLAPTEDLAASLDLILRIIALLKNLCAFCSKVLSTGGTWPPGPRRTPHPIVSLSSLILHSQPRHQRIQKRFSSCPTHVSHSTQDYHTEESRGCAAQIAPTTSSCLVLSKSESVGVWSAVQAGEIIDIGRYRNSVIDND